ncbi:RdgB/HAM1 family non-canonical purine NTP pyrophosphatase [Phyllobacterium sp. 21LDTY02-6]|uniref:RdgB/HAM1 family non-canonical purine NTP pyrophosphatase n=1 Tax=Phyllobacterium sp. 21LDTY02-6 TaxID=2944903 RepID=UPI00201FBBE1|nr:RdgB/HAM1 family non-canonical purine NTP pyrophosphatase [Phyllobacterium sp. 21LDTY02-6]MCO4317196.1 RdgB/HAM1 family non-canonical purine NTP pyrophosphatase [Phyllobacterium sp. 21LDTY02-6]
MRKLEKGKLLVASHNKGKIGEMMDLLGPFGFEVVSAAQLGLPEPEETGTTFEENAYIKAFAAAKATGLVALSDDSGLCVDALHGNPGVYTANWAELPDGTRDFAHGMRKVQDALQEKNALDPGQRHGRFVSVICLAWPDGEANYYRGEVEGEIVWPPRGTAGFGFDPVFRPHGHDRTFGEMTAEEKHGWSPGKPDALSHRARAFQRLAQDCLEA